jgi:hypothetical protein
MGAQSKYNFTLVDGSSPAIEVTMGYFLTPVKAQVVMNALVTVVVIVSVPVKLRLPLPAIR